MKVKRIDHIGKQHGQGAFMISIEVDSLERAVERLQGLGAGVSNPVSPTAFVSSTSAHGVLIQLSQRERR